HGIDSVNAERSKPAARRFRRHSAPRPRFEEQCVRKRHRALNMLDRAELAGADALAQLRHFRVEPAIVTDAESDVGLANGVHRRFGITFGEREGFFAKDMLAGRSRRSDLSRVSGRWRRQHNGFDLRIFENGLVIRDKAKIVLLGEVLNIGRYGPRGDGSKAHGIASLSK